MNLLRKPATLGAIQHVLENASEVTRQEAEAAGYTRWTLLKALHGNLDTSKALAVYGAGKPLFVLGHYPDPLRAGNRIMWFVATQAWFDLGATSVLYGRRLMRETRREHPTTSFTCISWSKHPGLTRWFAFQGFAIEERAGGATIFKCARRADKSGNIGYNSR